jgi:hypothetical protein
MRSVRSLLASLGEHGMMQRSSSLLVINPLLRSPTGASSKQLVVAFWVLAIALMLYELYSPETKDVWINVGAVMITGAALLPSYLWCAGKAQGIPIFPLFAITYVWTHALPLISNHPEIKLYPVVNQLYASLTTAGFLGLGTLIWFQWVKSLPSAPKFYRALGSRKGDEFFLLAFAITIGFNMANTGGWFGALDGGSFAIVRNTVVALTALSAFVLSYRFGTQDLSKQQSRLFIILIIAFMVTNSLGFLLVGAASVFLSAATAFIIGRKKIPLITMVIAIACLSFFHAGKGAMRAKYWFNPDVPAFVQPWQYPAVYAEWIDSSLKHFAKPETTVPDEEDGQSLAERSSVIHMLMLTQGLSPQPIPFLNGKTYAILPELLVPRVLNENKIRSHEGTFMLSVHYGRQTYEDTATTTIGWGMLAESYANFGVLGCIGLAVVFGNLYGLATRWSINAPILSLRSLSTVLILTYAFQTEWTAGVYVAAAAQHVIVLGGIAIFLMDNYPSSKPAIAGSPLWQLPDEDEK